MNHLSSGRLLLGMAVGGYADDYVASGIPFQERGKRFDTMLDDMAHIWSGAARGFAGAIGPQPGLDRAWAHRKAVADGAAVLLARRRRWLLGRVLGQQQPHGQLEAFRDVARR